MNNVGSSLIKLLNLVKWGGEAHLGACLGKAGHFLASSFPRPVLTLSVSFCPGSNYSEVTGLRDEALLSFIPSFSVTREMSQPRPLDHWEMLLEESKEKSA